MQKKSKSYNATGLLDRQDRINYVLKRNSLSQKNRFLSSECRNSTQKLFCTLLSVNIISKNQCSKFEENYSFSKRKVLNKEY